MPSEPKAPAFRGRARRAASVVGRLLMYGGARGATRPTCLCLALVLMLAGALSACAQSNGVPGAQDYAAFSKFVTDRNIFDPTRQPHNYTGTVRIRRTQQPVAPPAIEFVGTMSYEKGVFAFFSGNSTEMSKVAQVGDTVAGFTVKDISITNSVRLVATNQTEILLNVGDGLRQENNKWVRALADGSSASGYSGSGYTSSGYSRSSNFSNFSGRGRGQGRNNSYQNDNSSYTPAPPAPPPSAAEQNDVLKRLMQQREKENQ